MGVQRRFRGLVLGLLAGGSLAFSAVAQTPVRGGTLVVGSFHGMQTLDPVRSNDLSERDVLYLLYNTLVRLDTDFSVKPELAESWRYENEGLRLVLKLRPGVKFQDGTPVDAEAVKWNFDWRLNPDAKSPQRPALAASIQAVTVLDPLTVAVDTKVADPGLLGLLGQREGYIVSPTAVQKLGDDFGNQPVGSGPFILREWVRGNQLVVERNPSYWEAGKPYLDRIVMQNIAGSVVGLQRLRTGELDLIPTLTAQDALPLRNSRDIKLDRAPANRWYSLQWQIDKPPFDNPLLRRAIAHAIDRKKLVDIIMLGQAPIAESPTPEGLWWQSPEVKSLPYDPVKARELLKEAGYPNGLSIAMASPQRTPDSQISEVIQDQLKAVGITVTLEPVSNAEFYPRTVRRQINFTPMNWTQRPDPDGLFRFLFYTNAAQNSTGYSNKELDSLLDQARALTDINARKPLYTKAQQIIVDDLAYVSLFFAVQYLARRETVQGFTWIPDQIPRYRDVWKTASR